MDRGKGGGGGAQGYKEKKGGRRRQQCGVEVMEIMTRLSIMRETRENHQPERIGNRSMERSRPVDLCLPSSQEISCGLQIQE